MRTLVLGTAIAALAPGLALAGEEVVYDVDGQSYAGYYAAPQGDPQGLVLIIHDWDGLGDYEEQRADTLAEMGYAAFAVDLFGQGNPPRDRRGAAGRDRQAEPGSGGHADPHPRRA